MHRVECYYYYILLFIADIVIYLVQRPNVNPINPKFLNIKIVFGLVSLLYCSWVSVLFKKKFSEELAEHYFLRKL